jgi:hypothetical protein
MHGFFRNGQVSLPPKSKKTQGCPLTPKAGLPARQLPFCEHNIMQASFLSNLAV